MGSDCDVDFQEIDEVLQDWRQGDYTLGEHWFYYCFHPSFPLTQAAVDAAADNNDMAAIEVRGLVVVTQTCDIVRSCQGRPFIEVAPLVEVDVENLPELQRGRQSRYAYIPGAAQLNLVADLDRVMTVEKGVIANWERIPGCQSDEEIRNLRQALARKRIRFAFPDDFIQLVNKLQNRMKDKHNRLSDEGDALRSLREIRVRAEPSWEASEIQLMFLFIRHEEQTQFQDQQWDKLKAQWLDLIPETGRFKRYGTVITLEDITAKDYVESDPLDLDHLSL